MSPKMLEFVKFTGYALVGVGMGLGCTFGTIKVTKKGIAGWLIAAIGYAIFQIAGIPF